MPRQGELQPGDTLGGCRIEGLLGRGGMAVVYKAVQLSLERHVALKVLPANLARNDQFVKRFSREASALARLSHSNIVSILDKGVENHTYYFVMEYVEGKSLQGRLQREKKLSPQETHDILQGVCAALEYAHEHKIVHRDLKPGNILLDPNGTPKLADFGIARIIEAGTAAADRQLTMEHTVMGSADYMAPEQRRDAAKADHRADIYALGVMVYQMLTGHLPVGTFKPASRLVAGLSPAVDRAIRTALAPEPDDRFSSVARFRAAFNAGFSEASHRPARRAAPTPQKRSKAVGILATLGIMAALAGLVAFMLSRQGGALTELPPDDPKPPRKVVVRPPIVIVKKRPVEREPRPKGDGAEPVHVRRALARARAFAAKNPQEFQEQLEQLKDLLVQHNDREIGDAIRAERDAVLLRLGQAIDTELARVATEARTLADQRKFGDAFGLYRQFPKALNTDQAKVKIGKAVLALKQRARDTLTQDIGRVAELVKAGDASKAEALLSQADYAVPELKREAAAELQKLRALLAKDAAQHTADAKKALAALADTLEENWKGRLYPEALAAVKKTQADTGAGEALAPHLAAATLLDTFWKAVLEGANLHKGSSIRIKNTAYTLSAVDGTELLLKLGIGEMKQDLRTLDLPDLLFFAGSRVDKKKAQGQLTLALLHAYDRKPNASLAQRAFDQAEALGADKALVAALRDLGAVDATGDPAKPAPVIPTGFALDFNGTSDYVEVPERRVKGRYPLRLKTFTAEAWVHRRPGGEAAQYIIAKNAGWTNSVSFALYTHKNLWAYSIGEGITVDHRVTRTVAAFGAWAHVALVFDDGARTLFVDGQPVDRSKASKNVGYDDQPLTVGAHKVEGNMMGFWNGAIDEVRVTLGARYTKPFTPERQCRKDPRTQLLLRFEEGKGDKTRDLSPYGHHGQLHGPKFLDLSAFAQPTDVVAHWTFDKFEGSTIP
ncbi:protein kinase, partial [bacterium]|nr:protein kinase [bacterium]